MHGGLVLDGAIGLARPATDTELRAVVMRWIRRFVMRPHPRLGRPGPVCPFVLPSLRSGLFEFEVVRVGPDPVLEDVERLALAAADRFAAQAPADGDDPAALATTVTVIPDLQPDRWHLIDDAHAAIKTEITSRGLMIGQFHPECDAPAARNPIFPVNRSPVPLYAFRRMAVHDILFLADRPDWFEQYAERFGERLSGSTRGMGDLGERFRRAAREHDADADGEAG